MARKDRKDRKEIQTEAQTRNLQKKFNETGREAFEKQYGRKKVTVSDILTKDDIQAVLQRLSDEKPHIKELIAIWTTDDGKLESSVSDIKLSQVVFLLEQTKFIALNEE